jgi:hypothetical protein
VFFAADRDFDFEIYAVMTQIADALGRIVFGHGIFCLDKGFDQRTGDLPRQLVQFAVNVGMLEVGLFENFNTVIEFGKLKNVLETIFGDFSHIFFMKNTKTCCKIKFFKLRFFKASHI